MRKSYFVEWKLHLNDTHSLGNESLTYISTVKCRVFSEFSHSNKFCQSIATIQNGIFSFLISFLELFP